MSLDWSCSPRCGGGSFVFMCVVAPVLGAIVTADARVLIAGVALLVYFRVAFVARRGALKQDLAFAMAVTACLTAAICYGLAGVYIKKFASSAKPLAVAGMSQLMAGLLLLPLTATTLPTHAPSMSVAINVLALALLCSASAYVLYYRLVADVGPSKALTVTFLMPVFGMLWGVLFLGEAITFGMLGGCSLIVVGTGLVLRGRPRTSASTSTPTSTSTSTSTAALLG